MSFIGNAFAELQQNIQNAAVGGVTYGTGQTRPSNLPVMTHLSGRPVTVNAPALISQSDLETELNNIQGNNARWGEYVQLDELARRAGFNHLGHALEFAHLDPLKSERSWQDWLKERADIVNAPTSGGGGGGGGGGGPFSQKQTTVSLTSESGSASMLDTVYERELGRRAGADEIRAFHAALNEIQKQNPSVNNVTGSTSGSHTTSKQTVTSGFDPTRFAEEYARSQGDYAETKAGVGFMQVLDSLISRPNALDGGGRG